MIKKLILHDTVPLSSQMSVSHPSLHFNAVGWGKIQTDQSERRRWQRPLLHYNSQGLKNYFYCILTHFNLKFLHKFSSFISYVRRSNCLCYSMLLNSAVPSVQKQWLVWAWTRGFQPHKLLFIESIRNFSPGSLRRPQDIFWRSLSALREP